MFTLLYTHCQSLSRHHYHHHWPFSVLFLDTAGTLFSVKFIPLVGTLTLSVGLLGLESDLVPPDIGCVPGVWFSPVSEHGLPELGLVQELEGRDSTDLGQGADTLTLVIFSSESALSAIRVFVKVCSLGMAP